MKSLEYKIKEDILSKLNVYKKTNNLETLKMNYSLFFQAKIKDVRHSFPYAIEHLLTRNKNDFYTIFLARRNLIEDISYIKKFNDLIYRFQLEDVCYENLISLYIQAIENQLLISLFLADNCKTIYDLSNKGKNISKENVQKMYNDLINSCKKSTDIHLYKK